jgi:CRP/FNR family transcriptional regulator, cyclic AMP receptor protein
VAEIDPALIGRISAFSSLGERDREAIAAIATERLTTAGTILFRELDGSDDLSFILAGTISLSIRVSGHGEIDLLSLGPSELLGWSAMLGLPRTATARVTESGSVLSIPGQPLCDLCEAEPSIGYAVMKALSAAMADRLRDTRLRLVDVFGGGGSC